MSNEKTPAATPGSFHVSGPARTSDTPSVPGGGYMRPALRDDWDSPGWLVGQLAREFGPWDLDPAASDANAKAPRWYTPADDGLTQPWEGRVFCNPPYGRGIGTWLRKAAGEVAAGRAERVVALVPARVDTRWWRAAVAAASLVRVWPRRIAFGDGGQPAPFPSAVLVLGSLPGRHGTTPAWCQQCRDVFWPARAGALTCGAGCRQRKARQSRITAAKCDGGAA